MSGDDWRGIDLYAPTPEHAAFRATLDEFVAREVEPQAAEHDRAERFNHALFRKAGDLGLLGVTISEEYGGAGLDATASVLLFDALSGSDPGFVWRGVRDSSHSLALSRPSDGNGACRTGR